MQKKIVNLIMVILCLGCSDNINSKYLVDIRIKNPSEFYMKNFNKSRDSIGLVKIHPNFRMNINNNEIEWSKTIPLEIGYQEPRFTTKNMLIDTVDSKKIIWESDETTLDRGDSLRYILINKVRYEDKIKKDDIELLISRRYIKNGKSLADLEILYLSKKQLDSLYRSWNYDIKTAHLPLIR